MENKIESRRLKGWAYRRSRCRPPLLPRMRGEGNVFSLPGFKCGLPLVFLSSFHGRDRPCFTLFRCNHFSAEERKKLSQHEGPGGPLPRELCLLWPTLGQPPLPWGPLQPFFQSAHGLCEPRFTLFSFMSRTSLHSRPLHPCASPMLTLPHPQRPAAATTPRRQHRPPPSTSSPVLAPILDALQYPAMA